MTTLAQTDMFGPILAATVGAIGFSLLVVMCCTGASMCPVPEERLVRRVLYALAALLSAPALSCIALIVIYIWRAAL